MSRNGDRVTEAQVRRELLRVEAQESRRRGRIAAAVVLAAALAIGALAARFAFVLADVRTDGMAPGLRSGDVVLCLRTDSPLLPSAIERGGLALVRYVENGLQRQAVRRVVAVAGDEVSLAPDGRVTLNGRPLDEPYAVYRAEVEQDDGDVTPGGALGNPFAVAGDDAQAAEPDQDALPEGVDDMEYPLTVPEGRVFALCDNREDALDSRSSRFGLVGESDVRGLPRLVIWPLWRAGLLSDG